VNKSNNYNTHLGNCVRVNIVIILRRTNKMLLHFV